MASSNEEVNSENSFSSLTGTGNENTALATDGPSDSRCPICLERIRNMAFLNPCFHRFCFACILEWSERKAECPLCKQHFQSFFHTIRSDTDFEEYIIPFENVPYEICEGQSAIAQRPELLTDNGILYEGYSGPQSQGRLRTMDDLMRQLGMRRTSYPGGISLGQIREQVTIKFRRALYQSGVRIRNIHSGGLYRDISADFFHRNSAHLNRLVPWLKRELRVLCGTRASLINNIQHIILNNITIYDLDSPAFADIMQPHLRHYTNHFLHEFISFARSPFNIKAYDWRACYDMPFPVRDDGFQSYSSFTTSSSEEEDEAEEGVTDNSYDNEREDTESVSSIEEGSWNANIRGSTSSNFNHTLDHFFLPFGPSAGKVVRSEDNMHVFFQADGHLGAQNRHWPLHKCVLNRTEEAMPILCKSPPNSMENTPCHVDDEEEEETIEQHKALRSRCFGSSTHSSSRGSSGQLVSSHQMLDTIQIAPQGQERNSMDQAPLQNTEIVATKMTQNKGEELIVIKVLQPKAEDIVVIEQIEVKTREMDHHGQLSWQSEEVTNSAGLQPSAEDTTSGTANKWAGGFFSCIRRP